MSDPESFRSRSFRFAIDILKFYRQLERTRAVPIKVANQLLSAGTAIGANLAEARSAYSRRKLASKDAIALKEARECRFWLRLVTADQPRFEHETAPLIDECSQLIAMLTVSVRKLRGVTVAAEATVLALLCTLYFVLLN